MWFATPCLLRHPFISPWRRVISWFPHSSPSRGISLASFRLSPCFLWAFLVDPFLLLGSLFRQERSSHSKIYDDLWRIPSETTWWRGSVDSMGHLLFLGLPLGVMVLFSPDDVTCHRLGASLILSATERDILDWQFLTFLLDRCHIFASPYKLFLAGFVSYSKLLSNLLLLSYTVIEVSSTLQV